MVLPCGRVVDLDDATLAGREGALPAVPELDCTPLGATPRAGSAADIEDLALAAHDQAAEAGVTRESPRCFTADRDGATELGRLARTLTEGVVVDRDVDRCSFRIDDTLSCEVREPGLEELHERVGAALTPRRRRNGIGRAFFT